MKEVYQSNEDTGVIEDTLEAKVREGARVMLAAALEEEVNSFLGPPRRAVRAVRRVPRVS